MHGKEQVAPLGLFATTGQRQIGRLIAPGLNDRNAPSGKLFCQQLCELPHPDALIIALHRACVIVAVMPRIQAHLKGFAHGFLLLGIRLQPDRDCVIRRPGADMYPAAQPVQRPAAAAVQVAQAFKSGLYALNRQLVDVDPVGRKNGISAVLQLSKGNAGKLLVKYISVRPGLAYRLAMLNDAVIAGDIILPRLGPRPAETNRSSICSAKAKAAAGIVHHLTVSDDGADWLSAGMIQGAVQQDIRLVRLPVQPGFQRHSRAEDFKPLDLPGENIGAHFSTSTVWEKP